MWGKNWTILEHSRLFQNIPEYSKPFQTVATASPFAELFWVPKASVLPASPTHVAHGAPWLGHHSHSFSF